MGKKFVEGIAAIKRVKRLKPKLVKPSFKVQKKRPVRGLTLRIATYPLKQQRGVARVLHRPKIRPPARSARRPMPLKKVAVLVRKRKVFQLRVQV